MPPATATPTYVVGHRNPDADAICSAIAYAAYKEARGERGYVAARCGNSNARIDTILARFPNRSRTTSATSPLACATSWPRRCFPSPKTPPAPKPSS
ncbi:MAG: hypothetical protein RLZZ15_1896 [Verrucomicrobiota bacterium]